MLPEHAIETGIEGLSVRVFTVDDAPDFHDLVLSNWRYLTKHGAYVKGTVLSLADVEHEFGLAIERQHRFGIWLHDDGLIGRVDIDAIAPQRYGLGYWLAEAHQGRGYVTAAARAVLAVAATRLRATDVIAGTDADNVRSQRVLERLGFNRVEHPDPDRWKYHLSLCG